VTLGASESDLPTETEIDTEASGLGGFITGGVAQSQESGAGSGGWSETDVVDSNATSYPESFDSPDTGVTLADAPYGWESGSYTATSNGGDASSDYESLSETLGAGGVVAGGSDTISTSESSASSAGYTATERHRGRQRRL
jgi:hypothetical protein